MSRSSRQIEHARLSLRRKAATGDLELEVSSFERPIFCDLLPVLGALLEELAPVLASWAKSRIPWWIRWAVGGIVADAVVSAATEAIEDYRKELCTTEEEATE